MGLQDQAQDAIADLIASGTEDGVQVTVVHEGSVVVDAAAGVADPRTGRPVARDTLFYAASTGKGVASSVAHVLAEHGAIGYEQRIADVWPEFAAHGKGEVTLRDVLVHAAGVPGLWPDITPAELGDWDRVCGFLAEQRPWWPPGTATGYHALTFGFVLGEFVRRATGRTLAEALRDHISAPLGVSDELFFGVPDRLLPRVARQGPEGAASPAPEPGSPLDRAVPPRVQPSAAFVNLPEVLRADIPAQTTMTARAAARMYAALLGHVDDTTLVSPERLAAMARPAFSGPDQVVAVTSTWALGYSTVRFSGVESRPGSTFGMAGSNGSAAYADIDSGVAVAVMRNRVVGDLSAVATIDRLVAAEFG